MAQGRESNGGGPPRNAVTKNNAVFCDFEQIKNCIFFFSVSVIIPDSLLVPFPLTFRLVECPNS